MCKTLICHIFAIVILMPVCNSFADEEWPNLGACLPGFKKNYSVVRRGQHETYYRENSVLGRSAVLTEEKVDDVYDEEKFSLINKLALDGNIYVEIYDFIPFRDTNPTLVSIVKLSDKFLILYNLNQDEVLDLCAKGKLP